MGWLSYALMEAKLERCKTEEEKQSVREEFEDAKAEAMMDAYLELSEEREDD